MLSIAPVSAAAARERLITGTMEGMDRGGTDLVEDHHLQASDKSTCHEMDAPHPTMMATQILVTATTMAPQDWEEVASPLVDSLLDRPAPELHLGSVELAGVKDGTMKWKRVLNVNMQNFTDSILHWILGTSSEGQYIHVLHYSNVNLSYSGKNGEKKEQIEL